VPLLFYQQEFSTAMPRVVRDPLGRGNEVKLRSTQVAVWLSYLGEGEEWEDVPQNRPLWYAIVDTGSTGTLTIHDNEICRPEDIETFREGIIRRRLVAWNKNETRIKLNHSGGRTLCIPRLRGNLLLHSNQGLKPHRITLSEQGIAWFTKGVAKLDPVPSGNQIAVDLPENEIPHMSTTLGLRALSLSALSLHIQCAAGLGGIARLYVPESREEKRANAYEWLEAWERSVREDNQELKTVVPSGAAGRKWPS
jgi:hypothetical protein